MRHERKERHTLKTILLLYMGNETVTAGAGTEHVLTNMANALSARGFHVIVATNDRPDAEAYFPFVPQVECLYLDHMEVGIPLWVRAKRELNRVLSLWDHPFESYRAAISRASLRNLLGDRNVDVIIAYNHEAIQAAHGLFPRKVPLIAMMHNAIRVIFGNCNAQSRAEKGNADVIQVLMPSFVKEVKQYLPQANVVWIPNAVVQVPEPEWAALDQPKKTHTIITVGRLDPVQKQTQILVRAFSQLAADFPDWQLSVYGDLKEKKPYYHDLMEEIRAFGLESRVHLCGPTHDVRSKLRAADLFAFPSAYEGFPLALTEAMATGLPSVGFRSADAVKDLIVDAESGILCADGEAAFAKGLRRLMASQELRVQMGRKAAEQMTAYAPDIIWNQWQSLIENVIQEAGPVRKDK